METMKAIRMHGHGGPEVLKYEDAPRPKPGNGEVLIRVFAAGINPVDWKIREGHVRHFLTHTMPLIPGWDVSGVVESIGTGVHRIKEADEVYSRPDLRRNGSYAEYVVVKESEVALKPRSLDHINAAAVPLAALTAWQALFDTAQLGPDQTVLIHAAAGGVGSFAVQLAKWKGARIIGTASKRNHDFLKTLGADETIDYTATRFEDAVRDVDVVLDTISGETQERSWKVLKKGGFLVSILGTPSPETASAHRVRCAHTFVQPNVEQLNTLAGLLDSGTIKTIVETVLPLEKAAEAQELNRAGHTRGKIVLSVV